MKAAAYNHEPKLPHCHHQTTAKGYNHDRVMTTANVNAKTSLNNDKLDFPCDLQVDLDLTLSPLIMPLPKDNDDACCVMW
jgi:hypothetical protein